MHIIDEPNKSDEYIYEFADEYIGKTKQDVESRKSQKTTQQVADWISRFDGTNDTWI